MSILRKSLLGLGLVVAVLSSRAQELSQVTFSSGATLTYFSFGTDQGVLIRVSEDGRLLEWGTEVRALRADFYAPKLQPFAGGVMYYGPEGDSVSKGKVKMIGSTTITYYGPFEDETHIGKVKTIGRLMIDYYSKYDMKELRGKIKTLGGQQLTYYSPWENESYRGKLKAIGSSQITYYSNFDDRLNAGKIKSIGGTRYSWYSSFDNRNMSGGLKEGQYREMINGVTYILW